MLRCFGLLLLVACWQDRVRYVIQRHDHYTQCMQMDPPAEEPVINCWNDPAYTQEECVETNLLHEAEDGIHLRRWICDYLEPCGIVCGNPDDVYTIKSTLP